MVAFAVRKRYRPPWKRWNSKRTHPSSLTTCSKPYCSCDSSQASSGVSDHPEQLEIEAENEAAEPYGYSKLTGPGSIRILQLLPGRAGDPIQVQIEHISSSIKQKYIAVSYAWGNRTALRTIFCEGQCIQIPINLCHALTYMRHPLHPISLWADAICINQKDEAEKSRQVRRMRSIFMKAKKVTVWLGQDIRQSAKGVFQTMDAMTKQDFGEVPPQEDIFWRDVERLFRKDWFSRIWCLQEVILAADADVQWGTEVAPWKTVAKAATWIRSCPIQLLRRSAMGGVNNAHLMHMLGDDLKHNKLVSFLELLALSWKFKSSDRRDKVYSLLGVPTTNCDPGLGDVFVKSDYTKSEAEVYRQCALKIIRKTQSLRLLLYIQMTNPSNYEDQGWENLPSWVPRWHRYIHPMMAPSEQVSSFNACAALPSSVPRIENDTLSAQDRKFSRVRRVCNRAWDLDSDDNPQSVISLAWKNYLASSQAYKKKDEKLNAWCLVLTAGKDWNGELVDNTQKHLADMGAYMHGDDTHSYRNLPKTPVGTAEGGYRFDLAFRNACQGRKLLLTDDGYVGLGPGLTEEGDLVCLLSGLVMPIILRPTDKGYQVVGEAYVHGIMFGEASRKPGTNTSTELEEFMLH
ncbi:heterokaryon incompatibility protein-domain-containing protein [Xylaria digitata]|nr:heterokaryon incompatibility protein-domain-containing protein [Xylaria digitata]